MEIPVRLVGEVQDQDATRHRIKWYTGLAIFSDYGLARLKGINATELQAPFGGVGLSYRSPPPRLFLGT